MQQDAPTIPGSRPSWVARQLARLADWIYDYPRWFFYPQALLFLGCLLFTIQNLEFSTQRSDLVGANKAYHRNYLAYRKNFEAQDVMVAVVESEDLEKNRQFVERLGARLQAETNLFADVVFNNDLKMLGDKALLFFPEAELLDLRHTLESYRPVIEQFAEATNLHALVRLVNQQFRTAGRRTEEENEAMLRALPALERIFLQAADSLQRPGVPPSPGLTALFEAGAEAEQRIYITYDEGRLYLVSARAVDPKLNDAAVRRLRYWVDQIRREVPGVNAGITGEPVLEFDEMMQSRRDMTRATLISLALVALIFVYGYHETGRPIKATACLVVGLVYVLAFATGWIGHLNILTITFVPMMVGLAIDFGVHLITRYEEELHQGRPTRAAMQQALMHAGQGIFTGCLTTAGAFLAMILTDFRGIQEMGMICGIGLLICLVPMMTLLPVLLLRGHQNVLDRAAPIVDHRLVRIERLWLRRPGWVVACAAGLSLAAYYWCRQVTFDYNLLHMQTRNLAAVEYEHKLIRLADRSVLYCVVITDSLERSLQLETQVERLPVVAGVDSMARYLTEDQTRKLAWVDAVKATLEGLVFAPMDPNLVDVRELSGALWRFQGYLGAGAQAAEEEGENEIAARLKSLRRAVGQLRSAMLAGDRGQVATKLAVYQQALFQDVHDTFTAIQRQDTTDRMRVEDLPPALRHRFVSRDGQVHAIQVYPRADVWERANQAEFIGQLRETLDPEQRQDPVITGPPVQLYEYTSLLKESYQEAAWYSLAAIAAMVFIHFRSLISVVLALLPVGLGSLWTVGLMGACGIPFNPANIMTLPLVIGIGVTSGIHILNRFAEEQNPSLLAKSTGKAVFISGLTTIAGFGSLMLAQHQGIASLGLVMALGTAMCMLAALTVLPALLALRSRRSANSSDKRTQ